MISLFHINKFKVFLLSTTLITSFNIIAFANKSFLHDPMNAGKYNHHNSKQEKHKPLVHTKSLKEYTYNATKVDMHKIHIKRVELVEEGSSVLPADVQAVHAILSSFVGSLASASTMNRLTTKITRYYQDHGQLLAFAYVPTQSFDKGVVKINVIKGSIRDVIVKGDDGDIDSPVFNEYIDKILELNPVTKDELVRYLLLINKIPGYEIAYSFEPIPMDKINPENGKIADLVLAVKRTHAKVIANIDNYGASDLGRNQGSLGGQVLSPFNKDESIIGFVGTTNKPSKLKVATFGYKKIINSESTSVQFLGSYITNSANATGVHSNKNDIATLARASISHYPVLSHKTSLKLESGLKHNTQEVYNGAAKQSKYHVLSAFVGTEIQHSDALDGFSSFTPMIYKGISGASEVTMYDPTLKKYNPSFTLVNGNFWREQPLIGPMSFFFGANGQYSADELPLDDKFVVGGLFNARGYKSALVSANKGIGVTAEVRFMQNVESAFLSSVQPYGFYDFTSFPKSQALTNISSLSSVGAGVRLTFAKDINCSFEIGQPLRKNVIIDRVETKNNTRYSFILHKIFSW